MSLRDVFEWWTWLTYGLNDLIGFSTLNHCKIYKYHSSKWVVVKFQQPSTMQTFTLLPVESGRKLEA